MQLAAQPTAPDTAEADRFSAVLDARIRAKIADYERYSFTSRQSWAMNIFFDLAQEFEELHYLYHLPGQVLRLFFDIDSEFYTCITESGTCELRTPRIGQEQNLPPMEELLNGHVRGNGCWYFPARGPAIPGQSGYAESSDETGTADGLVVLGVLALYPNTVFSTHDCQYYEKFTNRFGFCLHNHLLAEKNREHIRFVRSLVHDIGHNVITPNLYFKLLIKQMEGKIAAFGKLCEQMRDEPPASHQGSHQALSHLYERMDEQYQELIRHFQQSSFFLETLLRQSHFDQGTYVLHKNSLDLVRQVVAPQLERYQTRFEEKGIRLEERYPADDTPLKVEADRGLLSQVLANLLSNATKYTRETVAGKGMLARCTVGRLPDYFGAGQDAARVSLLTSGPAIAEEERDKLFDENFRASNTGGEYGTGHGLHFIQIMMHQHGGAVGYARTEEGNIFYITLPAV